MKASSHSCAQPSACTFQSDRNMWFYHFSFQSYLTHYGIKSPNHSESQNHHPGLLSGFLALPSENYLPFKHQFKCFCLFLLFPKPFSTISIAYFLLCNSLNYCPFKKMNWLSSCPLCNTMSPWRLDSHLIYLY